MRNIRIIILVAIVAAACVTPIPEVTPTRIPWPTAQPVQLNIQAIEIDLLSEDPIILEGPEGQTMYFASPPTSDGPGIHALAIDPIDHQTYVGEGDFPSYFDHTFYHVASPDGLEWAVETEPLVFEVRDEFDPAMPISVDEVDQMYQTWGINYLEQLPDETWRAFLIRSQYSQPNSDSLWSMTAPDLTGPWTMKDGPLFSGDPGEWDADGLWSTTLLKVEGVYYLFYTTPSSSTVGLAVSVDGDTWEKLLPYEVETPAAIVSNRVFELDPEQDWYINPIWHSDAGWWMLFAPMIPLGSNDIYYPGEYSLAWSPDGFRWETADVRLDFPELGLALSLGPLFLNDQQIQGCLFVTEVIGERGHCFMARLIEHPRD